MDLIQLNCYHTHIYFCCGLFLLHCLLLSSQERGANFVLYFASEFLLLHAQIARPWIFVHREIYNFHFGKRQFFRLSEHIPKKVKKQSVKGTSTRHKHMLWPSFQQRSRCELLCNSNLNRNSFHPLCTRVVFYSSSLHTAHRTHLNRRLLFR